MIHQISLHDEWKVGANRPLPSVALDTLSEAQALSLKTIHEDAVFNISHYSVEQKKAWTAFPAQRLQEIAAKVENFYILDYNRETVGFASIRDPGYLWHLYFTPKLQRHGFGSALLKHVESVKENLDEEGYLSLKANTDAASFYLKHGYEQLEQTDILFGSETLSVMNMRKEIHL